MKIHTDVLTSFDIHHATSAAGMHGVYAVNFKQCGSRSKDHAFDLSLRGNSTRRPNPGTGGRNFSDDEYAATWDEWGMFIHALYQIDPDALIGQYGSRAVFEETTCGRFDELTAETACRGHRWVFGGPMIQRCATCDAVQNYGALYAKGSAANAFS
jgi:hypothetical protein